jgi:hypothetical protein
MNHASHFSASLKRPARIRVLRGVLNKAADVAGGGRNPRVS